MQITIFKSFLFILGVIFLSLFKLNGQVKGQDFQISDQNETIRNEIIRIILPGVFDIQSRDFVIRMRVWGVSFPTRGQPGFNEAIAFCEKNLLSVKPELEVKRVFDERNLKVVKVRINQGRTDFATESISLGYGWHDEKETGRFGPMVLAQLKAKRANQGIWKTGFNYDAKQPFLQKPKPNLSSAYLRNNQMLPQISYWLTSFGKIHIPSCTFYERGRGTLTAKPEGIDCRLCGGRGGKK